MSEPKKALRMNEGKPELDFLLDFPLAMEALARVMELGAVKYARDNWKLGGKPDSEYLAAALRHMMSHRKGELFADDSGGLHIAHALWNMAALIELNIQRTHDPELFAEMLAKWTAAREDNATTTEDKAEADKMGVSAWMWAEDWAEAAASAVEEASKDARAIMEDIRRILREGGG